jgi:NTE family protein
MGLVFGGGGARGFAHLGLIRALRDRGIAVDLTGGSSMGAFISALVASGFSIDDMVRITRDVFVKRNYLNDYSFSGFSLIAGRRFRGKLFEIFGRTRVENLPIPYFCVSTNLTRGAQVIHDRGGLGDWVATSMTVPGIGPPVVLNGDLLVDGGLLNNVPSDVMQSMGRGIVVASDVSSEVELRVEGVDSKDPLELLTVKAMAKSLNMAKILFRTATMVDQEQLRLRKATADLYLRMPVQRTGMFDWKAMDSLVEQGYQHAIGALAGIDDLLKAPDQVSSFSSSTR